jgi:hypothetical protein
MRAIFPSRAIDIGRHAGDRQVPFMAAGAL